MVTAAAVLGKGPCWVVGRAATPPVPAWGHSPDRLVMGLRGLERGHEAVRAEVGVPGQGTVGPGEELEGGGGEETCGGCCNGPP